MDQTHIGYTSWQEPRYNNIPATTTLDLASATGPSWGVAVEGSTSWWPAPADTTKATLPTFNPYQSIDHYIDIFNRSNNPFSYTIHPGAPWIQLSPASHQVDKEQRIWINIDWAKAPSGHRPSPDDDHRSRRHQHHRRQSRPTTPAAPNLAGSKASSKRMAMSPLRHSTMTGPLTAIRHPMADHPRPWPHSFRHRGPPVTAPAQTPGGNSPHLEYRLYLFDTGTVNVQRLLLPHHGI